ncbi:hypothetical protein BDR26DRAFT_873797 [Obelidium mucronatum]|nr:hypothetical protein BDR26DRAFT_873797 [Obelidium mucronatum]
MIEASMLYGGYLSQWDMRGNASPKVPQNDKNGKSQLLLGSDGKAGGLGPNGDGQGNAVKSASALGLTSTVFDVSIQDSQKYLMWVKKQVVSGNPVIIAVYFNIPANAQNEDEYDHIVTVSKITSSSTANLNDFDNFHEDDVLTFEDHGKELTQVSYSFGDFIKTRAEAAASDNEYSCPKAVKGSVWNYAIALTGVADKGKDTLPITITTNITEEPSKTMGVDGGYVATRPSAVPVTLSVTVHNLTPGVKYNLYTFSGGDDVGSGALAYQIATVPTGNFNANGKKAKKQVIQIQSGSTFSLSETIDSDEMRFYRAVLATAP